MGRHLQVNQRVVLLLKRQKGICLCCQLFFKDRDLLEIDHIIPRAQGGLDEFKNLQLLHRHCHDAKSAKDRRSGMSDKHQDIEESDEGKAFMSGFEDQQVERSAC